MSVVLARVYKALASIGLTALRAFAAMDSWAQDVIQVGFAFFLHSNYKL